MPAFPWFADLPQFNPSVWREASLAHDKMIADLAALSSAIVLGSRPAVEEDQRVNQAFHWTASEGDQRVREKYYLPDVEGFGESQWFHRKERDFPLATLNGVSLGFLK